MSKDPDFDLQAAHKFFAASCFNQAWDLIDKKERTPEEDEQMIRLSQASLWHWTQRVDCTARNLSVGYWQAARVYALAGRVEEAQRYGQLCLDNSKDEVPFYLGYAYESLARAEALAGDQAQAKAYLEMARAEAEKVSDNEARQMLLDDLRTILLQA